MSSSFDSTDLALFTKVIDQAGRDLGFATEDERSLLAVRVLSCAQGGERRFTALLACAKNMKSTRNASLN